MENMRNRIIPNGRRTMRSDPAGVFDRPARRVRVLLCSLSLLFFLLSRPASGEEELHVEGYVGTVAARSGSEVTLTLKSGIEFGREEDLGVYQKHDVIQVGGVTVKASWARIGKVRITALDGTTAEAQVVEERPDTQIRAGDEVGRLPNTAPEIVSILADSVEVRPRHEVSIFIVAVDDQKDDLYYSASANGGKLLSPSERSPVILWAAPHRAGSYEITIHVTDGKGGNTAKKVVMQIPPVTESDPYTLVSTIGGNTRATWQWREVTDIEVDERGNLWVLDAEENLLHAYSPTSRATRVIDLTHGESSYGVSPSKVLLQKEFVYVLDTPHRSLERLDRSGKPVQTIFDASTSEEYLIEEPSGLASTGRGDILLTDSAEGHVIVLDEDGRFVLLFSSTASGAGRLLTPVSVATNRYGDIFVLDAGTGKIAEFDSTFRYHRSYLCPLEGGAGDIVVDGRSGGMFVLACQKGSVRTLDAEGELQTHINPIAGEDSTGPAATSMALGTDGSIFMGTENASIWKFDPEGTLTGTRGEEDFEDVADLAATDDGTLLVLDRMAAQVKMFDRYRWLKGRFGEEGQYEGQFKNPVRIAIDGEGNSYVFDDRRRCIQRFYANGAFHKIVNISEEVAENLKDAVDIDVSEDGHIYVLDAKRTAVFMLAREGDIAKIVPLTTSGTRNGKQIRKPAHIAVDEKGNIFVSDPSTYVVYKFHAEGTRINKLGGRGTEPGQFGKIADLAVDKQGFVYVLLEDRSAVAKFAGDGRFIMEIPLTIGDEILLRDPEALAVDSFGTLYVSDSYYDAVFTFMQ
jgi:sugar lactone lactonase YvrE